MLVVCNPTKIVSISLVGEQTGPTTGPPPPVSDDTKKALLEAAEGDPMGQQVPGKDEAVKQNEAKVEKRVEEKGQGVGGSGGV